MMSITYVISLQPLESDEFRKQLKDGSVNAGAGVIMDFLDEQVNMLPDYQSTSHIRCLLVILDQVSAKEI